MLRFALLAIAGLGITACGGGPRGAGATPHHARFLPERERGPGLECDVRYVFVPEFGCASDLDEAPNLYLTHLDRMGPSLLLVSASYALDGAPLARFDAPGDDTPGDKALIVASVRIPPGDHELAVHLVYRGVGRGVFSYMNGYHFDLRSAQRFAVGEFTDILVDAFARGGPTTALAERPTVVIHPGAIRGADGSSAMR